MQIPMALPILAPQPTGHPASLPPAPDKPSVTQKVAPSSRGDASRDAQSRHAGSDDGQKTAPPSAIQLKIMEILEQQAKELAREAERVARSEAEDEAAARYRDDSSMKAETARADAAAAGPTEAAPAPASEPPRTMPQADPRPVPQNDTAGQRAETRAADKPQD